MSVVSRKGSRTSGSRRTVSVRSEWTGLSQDATNRAIALGQYRHEVQPDLTESLVRRVEDLKASGNYPEALKLLQDLPPQAESRQLLQGLILKAELQSLQQDYDQACRTYATLEQHALLDTSLS